MSRVLFALLLTNGFHESPCLFPILFHNFQYSKIKEISPKSRCSVHSLSIYSQFQCITNKKTTTLKSAFVYFLFSVALLHKPLASKVKTPFPSKWPSRAITCVHSESSEHQLIEINDRRYFNFRLIALPDRLPVLCSRLPQTSKMWYDVIPLISGQIREFERISIWKDLIRNIRSCRWTGAFANL